MTVMVLGPSKWRPRVQPRLPGWIRRELPPTWRPKNAATLSPLDIRGALAHHVKGVIMEGHQRRPREANTTLFKRVARQHRVTQFFVYWPFGAQRSGLDWELAILCDRLDEGEDLDVRVFVEDRAGSVQSGQFESNEMGRRTTYYEDLVTFGCPIIEWSTYDELWLGTLAHRT